MLNVLTYILAVTIFACLIVMMIGVFGAVACWMVEKLEELIDEVKWVFEK